MITLNKNGLHLCLMSLLFWLTFLVIKPCPSLPIPNKNKNFFLRTRDTAKESLAKKKCKEKPKNFKAP